MTDASIVLGYLNPATYAGGRFPLHPDLATEVVRTRIADPLGLHLPRAAAGIHEIVNTQMAEAVRLVSLQRGYDLRGIALVAMGGAGPVHAGRLLKLLQARAVVVPARPGVSSAYGLLLAQIRHEASRPYPRLVQEAEPAVMRRIFEEIDVQCRQKMVAEGVPLADVRTQRYAEMRYVGQSFELRVPFAPEGGESLGPLLSEFHATHDRVYGHHSPDTSVEILALRAVHLYQLPTPPPDPPPPSGAHARPDGTRRAFFSELEGYVDAPVYGRAGLAAGTRVRGPAIVDQEDTTTIVYPGQTASVHSTGILIIHQDAE